MLLALAVDFAAPLLGRGKGWVVQSKHFSERYGLILLIALGESIVAIGIGASDRALDPSGALATLLAVAAAGILFWAYFQKTAHAGETALEHKTGAKRNLAARDAYSYLHLVFILAIILFAVTVKKLLAGVTGSDLGYSSVSAAQILWLAGALFFLGLSLFQWRLTGTPNIGALVGTGLLSVITFTQGFWPWKGPLLAHLGIWMAVIGILLLLDRGQKEKTQGHGT